MTIWAQTPPPEAGPSSSQLSSSGPSSPSPLPPERADPVFSTCRAACVVPPHADVLAQTLAQRDRHGVHGPELEQTRREQGHTCGTAASKEQEKVPPHLVDAPSPHQRTHPSREGRPAAATVEVSPSETHDAIKSKRKKNQIHLNSLDFFFVLRTRKGGRHRSAP